MPLGWLAATRNSWAGLRHALRNERSVRQEAATLALGVVVAPLVAETWRHGIGLVSLLGTVVVVELLNNAVEAVCDRVTADRDPLIKVAKDSGSAAVTLTIAVAAAFWIEAAWRTLL